MYELPSLTEPRRIRTYRDRYGNGIGAIELDIFMVEFGKGRDAYACHPNLRMMPIEILSVVFEGRYGQWVPFATRDLDFHLTIRPRGKGKPLVWKNGHYLIVMPGLPFRTMQYRAFEAAYTLADEPPATTLRTERVGEGRGKTLDDLGPQGALDRERRDRRERIAATLIAAWNAPQDRIFTGERQAAVRKALRWADDVMTINDAYDDAEPSDKHGYPTPTEPA